MSTRCHLSCFPFCYSAEELLQHPFSDFVHPDDRFDTLAETDKLSSGEPTLSFENRYRCKDGSYRDLHWTSFPEAHTGLLYAIARDVTVLKRRQDQLNGLTGLASLRAFEETLPQEWSRARRLAVPITLALFDLDRFGRFNDAEGFATGDRVDITWGAPASAVKFKTVLFNGQRCDLGGDHEGLVA